MSSSLLEYAHTTLLQQRWYMDHILPEHAIRIIWCLLLMCVYALVELDYLPGKRWKIRKDMHTSSHEIAYYIKSSLINMIKWHIGPLIIYEIFLQRPNRCMHETPTWYTLFWKSVGYTIIFDICTHTFHHITHLHPQIAAFFHRAHAKHHASCGRYIYPWNGFYSSGLESFAGLIFFLGAMAPLRMDPLTRLVSILFIHFVATNIHSGYDFPWMFHNWNCVSRFMWHGSVGHYFHHQLGRKNLSTFWTFLDRWGDTYYDPLLHHHLANGEEFIYRRSQLIVPNPTSAPR